MEYHYHYKNTNKPIIIFDEEIKRWGFTIVYKGEEIVEDKNILKIACFVSQDLALEFGNVCRNILEIKGLGSGMSKWYSCIKFSQEHLSRLKRSIHERMLGLGATLSDQNNTVLLHEHIADDQHKTENNNVVDGESLKRDLLSSPKEKPKDDNRFLPIKWWEVEIDEIERTNEWWKLNGLVYKSNKTIADDIRTRVNQYSALGFNVINPIIFDRFLKNVQESFYCQLGYYTNPSTMKLYFTCHIDLMYGIYSQSKINEVKMFVGMQKILEPILWNEEYVAIKMIEMKRSRMQ